MHIIYKCIVCFHAYYSTTIITSLTFAFSRPILHSGYISNSAFKVTKYTTATLLGHILGGKIYFGSMLLHPVNPVKKNKN